MKILSSLTLLLLLVLFALAWATWDMQRREAVAPGVELAALQAKAPPSATTTNAPSAATNAPPTPAMAVCPTCHGKRDVHLAKEAACQACGGTGVLPGKFSSHGTTICNACRGSGKISKDTKQDCPTCQRAGQITQAMAAQFKTCPKCQGVKTVEVTYQVTCQSCRGSGKSISEMTKRATGNCPFCNGTGKLERKEKCACPDCFGSGLTYQPTPPAAPGT
jgi:DnaJ-class molecular chaperone